MGAEHPRRKGRAHPPRAGRLGPLQTQVPATAPAPRAIATWGTDPAGRGVTVPAAYHSRPAARGAGA
eukprot:12937223-Prorocentrum_lima.AAC.1